MESSRIQEECLAMYKVRLQNLPKIINELYQVVKNDEVINNLTGESMEKYKVGRVNQVVFEVMNSQKQLLLIRALERCAELNNKIKNIHEQENTANSAKRENYFDGLIELKQRTDKQIASLNLLIDEKTKIITRLNKENSQLQQKFNQTQIQQTMKLHQPCPNCERISHILAQSKNELQINKQFIQKLKKDGQTAVQALLNKVQVLTQKNCALEAQKQRKSIRKLEVKQNKEQSKHRCEQMRRSQKIQKMKRQMVNVEEQLVEVQRQFNFIKQMVMGTIINDFKKIKNEHLMLKQCVSNYRSRVTTQLHNFVSQMNHKLQIYCLKKNDSILKPERIMSKLNYLENQIDYFLENQVMTE